MPGTTPGHFGAGADMVSMNPVAMVNEVLCKIICHNLTCLIQEQESLGIVPVFWKDEEEAKNMVQTAVLAV